MTSKKEDIAGILSLVCDMDCQTVGYDAEISKNGVITEIQM